MRKWSPTLGAIAGPADTTFRVWAPDRQRVDLIVEREPRPLSKDDCGYWSGTFPDVRAGARYRYRLDGDDAQTFPDPASRFQPEGVHGPSQVIDPGSFAWTDAAWQPPRYQDLVIYELHVGTFTPEGTFRAAIERLAYLKDLGVSALEIMPVGDFPGDRNWGYDGVAIYAPARCYGTPDDLRALVDAAHATGLAVILDVVYNHLGPDGAYATAFSRHYFTDRHRSPWGQGVNLDGPHRESVRRFLIENALHWVREYHIDGLRLDATHALVDDSQPHFLAELTATVRAHAPKPVVFIAEDHRNLAALLQPVDKGGYGLDGVWADDFHHEARVHTAHDHEGYYRDFTGTAADLATTIRQGWFFTGQRSEHLGEDRGTDPSPAGLRQFVICIQNHDQVGNRADGARLNHQIDPAVYRALTAVLLLAPETPLLFMGQEWAATSPFLFFTDHHDELGRQVTEGRREEFGSFAAFRDPAQRARIPDPQAEDTFSRSRLVWSEVERQPHAGVRRLYQRLLALRRGLPEPRREQVDVRVLDAHTIAMQLFSRRDAHGVVVVARLAGSGDATLPIDAGSARVLLTSEDADVVSDPVAIDVDGRSPLRVRFGRPGALVLGSCLAI
jgi:maltooligosyltrehalose trehalohydrolase